MRIKLLHTQITFLILARRIMMMPMNDEKGCDMHVSATDLENSKIKVGVTFKDGFIFK